MGILIKRRSTEFPDDFFFEIWFKNSRSSYSRTSILITAATITK
jgi:hypothetical protein